MKTLKYIFAFLVGTILMVACNKGIDPISYVAPGTDQAPPVVTVTYPFEGAKISVPTTLATITIKFSATDDIELKSVAIVLDGSVLTSIASFKDYRRALESYTYDQLSNGSHTLTIKAIDMTDKETDKVINFEKTPPYVPLDHEVLYMPFDGDYVDMVTYTAATVTGSPSFATGKIGNAYAGASNSYISFPTTNLANSEFSATFWYKVNSTPDRSGIIVVSPQNTSGFDASRTHGFRLFREANSTNQQVKLNVGIGSNGESWNNGGLIDPSAAAWVHVAFTISGTQSAIYINGTLANSASYTGPIDWTGCTSMSIGSGQPYFIDWGHLADNSLIDDLHVFDKALTQAEIQTIMGTKK